MRHLLLTTIIAVLIVVGISYAGPIHDAAERGDLAAVQIELNNGGYILSGTSTISNLSFDAILIKTNTKGKSQKNSN